jgi:CubicO group peptidase (beta-lactamase class C family)
VVLIGHEGKVVYRRPLEIARSSHRELMTVDTIFDPASLTKVIATTTSVMQLVERGKVRAATRL